VCFEAKLVVELDAEQHGSDQGVANDIGYLTALYKMSPDSTIQVQRNEMAFQMEHTLDGH
jgi:hypothetical protein